MVHTYRSRPDLGKLLHFDEKGTDPFEPGSGGCLADDLHRHDADSPWLQRVVRGYQETVVLYFHHGPGRDIFPSLPFRFCGDLAALGVAATPLCGAPVGSRGLGCPSMDPLFLIRLSSCPKYPGGNAPGGAGGQGPQITVGEHQSGKGKGRAHCKARPFLWRGCERGRHEPICPNR